MEGEFRLNEFCCRGVAAKHEGELWRCVVSGVPGSVVVVDDAAWADARVASGTCTWATQEVVVEGKRQDPEHPHALVRMEVLRREGRGWAGMAASQVDLSLVHHAGVLAITLPTLGEAASLSVRLTDSHSVEKVEAGLEESSDTSSAGTHASSIAERSRLVPVMTQYDRQFNEAALTQSLHHRPVELAVARVYSPQGNSREMPFESPPRIDTVDHDAIGIEDESSPEENRGGIGVLGSQIASAVAPSSASVVRASSSWSERIRSAMMHATPPTRASPLTPERRGDRLSPSLPPISAGLLGEPMASPRSAGEGGTYHPDIDVIATMDTMGAPAIGRMATRAQWLRRGDSLQTTSDGLKGSQSPGVFSAPHALLCGGLGDTQAGATELSVASGSTSSSVIWPPALAPLPWPGADTPLAPSAVEHASRVAAIASHQDPDSLLSEGEKHPSLLKCWLLPPEVTPPSVVPSAKLRTVPAWLRRRHEPRAAPRPPLSGVRGRVPAWAVELLMSSD
jgi:hypothetical protein